MTAEQIASLVDPSESTVSRFLPNLTLMYIYTCSMYINVLFKMECYLSHHHLCLACIEKYIIGRRYERLTARKTSGLSQNLKLAIHWDDIWYQCPISCDSYKISVAHVFL